MGVSLGRPFRVVTRLCEGRSLFTRLHRKIDEFPKLDATALRRIAYQVASAMAYLHEKRNIVHRDLKTLNVLLDAYGNAYVADFGLSAKLKPGTKMHEKVGTPNYTAPEILLH
jgi:serine/threonine protein kinase